MDFGSGDPLDELNGIYSELDVKISAFSIHAGLSCPSGCGRCCETFIPEITRSEADYIASHLLGTGHPLTLDSWTVGELDGACPFFRIQGDPYHCSIYQARPLICRLFGFSGSRDKNSILRFRPCRYMPVNLPDDPDISLEMSSFGHMVENIHPGGVKYPIGDAVKVSLTRLLLRSRLEGSAVLPDTAESTG